MWNIEGLLKYSFQRQFRSYTHHIQEHQKKQQKRKSTDNSPRCALLFICSSSSKDLYSFSLPSRITSLSFILIGDHFVKLLQQSVNDRISSSSKILYHLCEQQLQFFDVVSYQNSEMYHRQKINVESQLTTCSQITVWTHSNRHLQSWSTSISTFS